MSQRERDRLKVLHEVGKGQVTQKQAADQLKLSERQVRRMLEAVDSKVLKLVRTHIGPISIGKLQIGQHRPMSADEVKTLKDLAEAAASASGDAEGGSSRPSSKTSAAKQRMHQTRDESSERWSTHEED